MIKRITVTALGALALSVSAAQVGAQADSPQISSVTAAFRGVPDLVKRYGFSGDVGVGSPDGQLQYGGPGTFDAKGKRIPWRWASVTKQVVAVLVLQEVGKGKIELDAPVSRYLPKFRSANAATLTVRQLLRHQSGLPNPESTAPKDGAPTAFHMPGYNVSRDPVNGYCAGPVTGKPGGNWAYNNCDYIVAGALLEAVTGQPWRKLVQSRIAKPLGLRSLGAFPAKAKTRPGFDQGKPEPAYDLASFGAAGALYGSAADLLKFDQALMSGTLLGPAQLKELWDGQENLGYIALGQWAFTVPLKGCADPVRIVERRGAIGGVQVRNFILPEKQIAVVAFTDRGEFDFGEIWQASGFSHDLLALAACGTGGT